MLYQDLLKLRAIGKPIRVGVSGAGWIGSGFVTQLAQVPGMQVNVLADENLVSAKKALVSSGVPVEKVVEAYSVNTAMDVLRSGKRVITPSYQLAAQLDDIDIVVDATSSPSIGAETAHASIEYEKDIVLVNIEADVTVGRILKKLADKAGILYTVSTGDEPGCLMELWDFVTSLGYQPIVIGKGKNNPLDPTATPDSVRESAIRVNKDPYQVASYVDGTKTMIEMACAANATGCPPLKPGMVGAQASLETISQIYALEEDGGMIKFPGVVDFVQGSSMAGGVFITVRIENQRIQQDLEYLKVGKGKYYTFFRPYHLWFLEASISVARAFLYRHVTLVPGEQPIAEVMVVAKKDLSPGEELDGFGGYSYYGLIDRYDNAQQLRALPIGLAPDAVIVNAVAKGEIITWDDVSLNEGSLLVRLRRQQDNIIF